MKSFEIEGVIVQPLEQIEGNCGRVLRMLRSDSSLFSQFGEIYFSEIILECSMHGSSTSSKLKI